MTGKFLQVRYRTLMFNKDNIRIVANVVLYLEMFIL
jgi:hypothetical protein